MIATKRKKQLYFNAVLIYTLIKVKFKRREKKKWLCHNFLFTSKIKTYYDTLSLYEEKLYYLIAFSLQQLAIIRQKNHTFVYRKRGELLDGKATSKRAGRCLHMHAASESRFVKQTQFFHDSRERTLERQKWRIFLPPRRWKKVFYRFKRKTLIIK